jgi:hypothetical protein
VKTGAANACPLESRGGKGQRPILSASKFTGMLFHGAVPKAQNLLAVA